MPSASSSTCSSIAATKTTNRSNARIWGSVLLALYLAPTTAWGQDIGFTRNADLNFGVIDFASSHAGNLELGTNGILDVSAGGLAADSNAQAGSFTITSPETGVITIKCTASGRMQLGNLDLPINDTEVAINIGQPFGQGTACQGIRESDQPAAVIDLSLTPTPNILIGGRVDISSNELTSGTYDTSAIGGQAVILNIIVE